MTKFCWTQWFWKLSLCIIVKGAAIFITNHFTHHSSSIAWSIQFFGSRTLPSSYYRLNNYMLKILCKMLQEWSSIVTISYHNLYFQWSISYNIRVFHCTLTVLVSLSLQFVFPLTALLASIQIHIVLTSCNLSYMFLLYASTSLIVSVSVRMQWACVCIHMY